MPKEKRSLKVFLSYSTQDRPIVRELSQFLAAEGWIDPWLDVKKLLPGQDWRLKIEEAVETSDVVIICLSTHSVTKEGYVQKELRYAREIALEKPEETIFLIPLRLDECDVPRGLRFYQWVDYFGEKKDEAYKALIESLKLRYDQKLRIEEVERAHREKEDREREAAEEAARKKAEQEAAERIAQEKEEREAAEKASSEKVEREAAEKALQEKAKREADEKSSREKAKRQAARKAALLNIIFQAVTVLKSTQQKSIPVLRVMGILGIIAISFWGISLVIPKFISFIPTVEPSATITPTATHVLPTKTLTLTPTRTHLPTLTPSFTPTVTFTPTSVPPSSILFQRDFENGAVGGWLGYRDGIWAVEQEPDGNHCLSGSGPATSTPQIWYTNEQIRWTDYALETRVKFTKGHILYILVRSDVKSGEHYGVALNDVGFSLMRTWSMISNNISMILAPNRWYTIRVEISGDSFSAYIDNDTSLEIELYSPVIQRGGFGYGIEGGENVCLDDIKAWSLK